MRTNHRPVLVKEVCSIVNALKDDIQSKTSPVYLALQPTTH